MLVFAYILTFLRSFMWAAVILAVLVVVVGSCAHPAPAPAAHGGSSSSYLMDAQHKLRCTYNDGALVPCWRA